jgi:hypothetical protein
VVVEAMAAVAAAVDSAAEIVVAAVGYGGDSVAAEDPTWGASFGSRWESTSKTGYRSI